ncbi:MAG: transposase, partial [Bacteroidia bacterium]
MYFKGSIRTNPATGEIATYYRLVESYRNIEGRVCHRTLLNVGFLEQVSVDQLNKIQSYLNARYKKQETLFEEADTVVKTMTEQLWQRLVNEKRIDIDWADQAQRHIDVDTIKYTNVREVGTEWMCYHTWNQLQLTEFLQEQGWNETQIQLAAT